MQMLGTMWCLCLFFCSVICFMEWLWVVDFGTKNCVCCETTSKSKRKTNKLDTPKPPPSKNDHRNKTLKNNQNSMKKKSHKRQRGPKWYKCKPARQAVSKFLMTRKGRMIFANVPYRVSTIVLWARKVQVFSAMLALPKEERGSFDWSAAASGFDWVSSVALWASYWMLWMSVAYMLWWFVKIGMCVESSRETKELPLLRNIRRSLVGCVMLAVTGNSLVLAPLLLEEGKKDLLQTCALVAMAVIQLVCNVILIFIKLKYSAKLIVDMRQMADAKAASGFETAAEHVNQAADNFTEMLNGFTWLAIVFGVFDIAFVTWPFLRDQWPYYFTFFCGILYYPFIILASYKSVWKDEKCAQLCSRAKSARVQAAEPLPEP